LDDFPAQEPLYYGKTLDFSICESFFPEPPENGESGKWGHNTISAGMSKGDPEFGSAE
jgi:hypothetical protein